MKAITVKYHGWGMKLPSRYIARDSDGHSARSLESSDDAARALCTKMNWRGTLAHGGTGDAEVYVFLDSLEFIHV